MSRKKKPNKRNQTESIKVGIPSNRDDIEALIRKKKNCSVQERRKINKEIRLTKARRKKLREEVSVSDSKPRKYPQYTISYPQHRINNWISIVSVPFGGQNKK